MWKTLTIIPIPKPGNNTSLRTSYRLISLLCPSANVLECLILQSVNMSLLLAQDQHGFRSGLSKINTSNSLKPFVDGCHVSLEEDKPIFPLEVCCLLPGKSTRKSPKNQVVTFVFQLLHRRNAKTN